MATRKNLHPLNNLIGAAGVRLCHGGLRCAKPKGEVVADILASIKERRA